MKCLLQVSTSALLPSEYRKIVKGWDKNKYRDIFKHYTHDPRAYRIYLNLDRSFELPSEKPPKRIVDYLESIGFYVENYTEGMATSKDGRTRFKIGRLLKDRPDLKKLFDNDSSRQAYKATKGSLLVVISRHPYDIAGMSTGRGWTSCMNLGKENAHYVPIEVKQGTIIAYAIYDTDKNINRPICRVLLKPFVNKYDTKDVVLGVSSTVYGTEIPGFRAAVVRWANEVNKRFSNNLGVGVYLMEPNIYEDEESPIKISPELKSLLNRVRNDPSVVTEVEGTAYEKSAQLALLDENFQIMQYVEHPSEELQQKALLVAREQGISHPLRSINNPSYGTMKAAIEMDGNSIHDIKSPSSSLREIAIRSNPLVTAYLKPPPTEGEKELAINLDVEVVKDFRKKGIKLSDRLRKLVADIDPSILN